MAPNAGRTVHGIPRYAQTHAANPLLKVTGLVERSLELTPEDIARLPRVPYLGELSCAEGGNMPAVAWSGVSLADLVALAEPDPTAPNVRVSAGPYAVPVSLADAIRVLMCDQLDGVSLGVDQGGPWRLVVPGTRYFTSVKWVNCLELTAGVPDNSAERIAKARARARAAKGE